MNDNIPPSGEPSVLDYLKSRLSFGRRPKIEIPESSGMATSPETVEQETSRPADVKRLPASPLPWLSLLAMGLALLAQRMFEPQPSKTMGSALYLLALALLLWSVLRGEWRIFPLAESSAGNDPLTLRWFPFLLSVLLVFPAFILLGGAEITPDLAIPKFFVLMLGLQDNLFTWFNLTVWLVTVFLFVWSLWLRDLERPAWWRRAVEFVSRREWHLSITRWTLLILALSLVVIFFRVYHIQQTPAEPFSDHAEKLLDVYDVTQGLTHIFFPRNTGREAIQFYWTILMNWIFGTGLSFLTLKIGTVAFGLLTLPYMYLLGREVGGRRVGLFAFLLAGIGYWPNLIARIGLRFPLYPLFVAPMLFHLIRGLRTRRRNDFILSGLFLGLGLNGYTPYRIVPFLVVAAFILYMLHAQSKGARRNALAWFVIVGLTAFMVFIPLFRYAMERPDLFSYRALTRLEPVEQPLPAPWYQILGSNVWNGLKMFNLDDGNIWVAAVPNRPALDIVSGALFLLGIGLLLIRYVQKRHWLDLFLILSIPILQLPSTLSIAFPSENPALNRAGGSFVPTFLIVALALDGFVTAFGSEKRRQVLAWILTGVLLFWSAAQNYDLLFNQFDQEYRLGSWNTSEMGAVIKQFSLTYGETDTVWVVPFPYWVDTRLPGVWAGIPNRDFAMFPDHLADTLQSTGPKLFIVKANLTDPTANDQKSLDTLKQLYPQGSLSLHHSAVEGHDFWIYFVPSQ